MRFPAIIDLKKIAGMHKIAAAGKIISHILLGDGFVAIIPTGVTSQLL